MRVFRWAALLAALFIFSGVAAGQGSRYDNVVFNASGRPVAGATIRVCTSSWAGTAASDCTPLASIYSDSTLTTVKSNPFAADSLGNYGFWSTGGNYKIQVSGPGITRSQFDVTMPGTATITPVPACTSAGFTAALALLPSTGGVVDAQACQGAQTLSATVVVNKPAKILLGAATWTATVADPGQTTGAAFSITSNDVSIEGVGWNSIIKKTGATNQQALISSGAFDRITVKNLKLDGDEANHTTTVAKFYTCWRASAGGTDLTLEKVEVTGCGNRGIDWRGVNRVHINDPYFHQTGIATVGGVPLDGNATSVDVDGATGSTDAWFRGGQYEEWGDSAIAAPDTLRVHIDSPTLRGRAHFGNTPLTNESGIDLFGASGVEVKGAKVYEVRGPVLAFGCSATNTAIRGEITGNEFYNVTSPQAGDPRVQLGQSGNSCQPTDLTYTGNTHVGTRVSFGGIDGFLFAVNTFRNIRSNIASGIAVDVGQGAGGVMKNFVFFGNKFDTDDATLTRAFNIASTVTAPGNSGFIGNSVSSAVTNAIVYQAGSTKVFELWGSNYQRFLNNTTGLCWRNAADAADLCVKVNASDQLSIGALPLVSTVATGTAPHVLASTTKIVNANADLLDDMNSATAATNNTIAARDGSGNLTANSFISSGSTPQIVLPNYTTPAVSAANEALCAYQSASQRLTCSFNAAAHSNVLRAADWAAPGAIGGTTPAAGTFTRTTSAGTDHVAGDYALHANWGGGAAVAVVADSKDEQWRITVTAGTVPGASPTVILTFKNGAFGIAPICLINQQGGTGARADVDVSTTTTTATLTFIATPVDTLTYIFAGHCKGNVN